jgi:signal transduction histidine kinase
VVDTSIAELEARLASASTSPVVPVERIDALTQLAWALRTSDVSRSNALATEARDLAIEHAYKLGQARAARTMAMTMNGVDDLRSIFPLAEEAKRLFDELNDGPGRAASRDFLASLHEFIGDLAGGMELALSALSIAREIDDPIRQGYALSSVGGILARSGEIDPAIDRLKEALQIFEDAESRNGVATICSRLCKVLKSAGRHDEALGYAQVCRDAAAVAQNEFLDFSALTVMAAIEDERGDAAEAERLYREALGTLTTQPARDVIGTEAQVALGRLLLAQGALADAEIELIDALNRTGSDPILIVNAAAAHEALAELRERQDKLPIANEHLRKAQVLRERISQQDARNNLVQVEVRAAMETAKKDAEIHKLRFVELHRMQSKLVEAEKMALLGKLAAGTAHELHTPLGVLHSNTNLTATATQRLASMVRDDGEIGLQATKLAAVLESCRQSSEEALERIAAIAESLSRFTQLDRAERRSFDVREGLDSALALLEPTVSDSIKWERHFEEVPPIDGWARTLNHGFMTVLQNAAQAIDKAGVVSIETRATTEHVLVHIRDTGRGMSNEQAAHLFDVTWSEEGTRTSMRLGLSAAYTTMQNHGGTIEVESVLGQGTTVTFRFPL